MRTEDEIRSDAADERPFSNGSEHDIWADRYCYNRCVHDDPDADPPVYCPIITVAMFGKGAGPMWPAEWTRHYVKFGDYVDETRTRRQPIETTADDPDGFMYVGECTEYEERRDPGPGDDQPDPEPPPVCDGQLDLIDAYLPAALDELTRAPAVEEARR